MTKIPFDSSEFQWIPYSYLAILIQTNEGLIVEWFYFNELILALDFLLLIEFIINEVNEIFNSNDEESIEFLIVDGDDFRLKI